MFDIAIQAAIGGHIISRSTVKAMRKRCLTQNVYGGDVYTKKEVARKTKEMVKNE